MEDARTQAARRHFDRWSRTYERDRASQRLQEAQNTALAALELRREEALLDVACGTGAAVREAAATVRRAVGFDLSASMIAQARILARELDNVELQEGDIAQGLPFADGEFTAVLCTTAFHHFTDQPAALAEMTRVLGPDGRLVIADANTDALVVRVVDLLLRRFQRSHVAIRRPSWIVAELLALGFAEAAVAATLWHGGYAIVRARKPG